MLKVTFLSHLKAFADRYIPQHQQGVLLALISTCLFVIVGIMVRILSESIDLFQILLFRQLVFGALLLPAMVQSIDLLLRPKLVHLHLLRISGAFLALYLGFVTVSNLPLANAIALGFTQVLFVAVISKLLLDEAVGWRRSLTIIIGFIGVMLVVQPDFSDGAMVYILAGLGGGLGAAIAVICVRKVAQTEPRITLLAYQAVFVGLVALIPALIAWQWPTFEEFLLLLLVGVISSAAQWIGVTAYKPGEANVIANVEYSKMIYSVLFGYFLFSEMPDLIALIGVLLILCSPFISLRKSR